MRKNTNKYLQICFKTLLILVVGILLGALLLTLAYRLPVNWGSYHSTELSTELQGWYPNVPNITNSYNTYFQTYLPGVLDNATVRTYMLPLTWELTDNPLYTAMYCNNYSYYWHGYVIVLRFLQMFLNYEQIQMANAFFQIALIVALAVLIGRKKNMKYIVMLISSYVLMMPIAVALCLQYYSVFNIAYGACVLLLAKPEFFNKGNRLFYSFLIIGMLTSYFDLLTYPLITWGIPVIWWIVMDDSTTSLKASLQKIISLGIAWIIGYGGMWAGKWVLATIVLQENVIIKALREVILRSGVDESVTFGLDNRFYSLYVNWMHYTYKLYALILIAWLLYWLVCGFLFGWSKLSPARCFSYILAGCSSFVWYIAILNHTEVHHAFTYRIFSICILAFFAIVLESTSYEKKQFKPRRSLCFAATGIGLMIISVFLALCAKEITQVDNKNHAFEERLLEDEELCIRFVPKHDRILALGIGLKTKSDTGWYELSLSDGETVVYTETIPATYNKGNNYRDYVVDWNLTAGQEYFITVRIHDVGDDVYAYYTADGFLPLDGCQYYEDGSPTPSQPLFGTQYWCSVSSKKTLALLAVTYWGLLWTIAYAITCIPALPRRNPQNNNN